MTAHDQLFVAGIGRSGTTALRRVLGTHPDLAIGMERFKGHWGAIEQITPELFERERFFDYSDGLTNITPAVPWARERLTDLEAKWDTARYRGDKMTTVQARRLWEAFPEARFVFIVRDIAQVASSWDRRATDAGDTTWRGDRDATASVTASNQALRRIRRAVTLRPAHAVVVEHARFFGDPEATSLLAVMDFLGIDPAGARPEWEQAHHQYVDSVAGRDRTLSPDVTAFVAEHADHEAWRDVVRLAV